MHNGSPTRIPLKIAAGVIAVAAAMSLSACGSFDKSMRSYDDTKRPKDVAEAFEPLVREINAGLGGKADVAGEVEATTCGGDWKGVEGDPLGVKDSPYLLTRRVDLSVTEPAETLQAMTALRDHLSRAGWKIQEDTLKPFTRNEIGPTVSLSTPGFRSMPPEGADTVSTSVIRLGGPLIIQIVVSSGCYRHPDEQ